MTTAKQTGPRIHRSRGLSKHLPLVFPYWWRNMRPGMKKLAASPIDAVLEVLAYELGNPRLTELSEMMGTHASAFSHVRNGRAQVPHVWLLRAAIYSGIPYEALCQVAGMEPVIEAHYKAWKTTAIPPAIPEPLN